MFKGIAASPGIATGRVYIYRKREPVIHREHIAAVHVPAEEERLDEAVRLSKIQLEDLRDKVAQELGASEASIFEAHLMMLDDPAFVPEIKDTIRQELIKAEHALFKVVERYVQTFNAIEDEYLKGRAADLKDIGERLAGNLLGMAATPWRSPEDAVIPPLTCTDTARLDKSRCRALLLKWAAAPRTRRSWPAHGNPGSRYRRHYRQG